MGDGRIERVRALLAECHNILVEMYPTRHWDEPMPKGPMLDLCQADCDVQDAFIKLGWYQQRMRELAMLNRESQVPAHLLEPIGYGDGVNAAHADPRLRGMKDETMRGVGFCLLCGQELPGYWRGGVFFCDEHVGGIYDGQR